MYTKRELELLGFNEKKVKELESENLSKQKIEDIKAELLKYGFAYEGNYKKFIDEMEVELLKGIIKMQDVKYYYFHETEQNEITDLLTIKVMDDDTFNNEYKFLYKSNVNSCYGKYYINLPVIIATDEYFSNCDYYLEEKIEDMEKNFGIQFLDRYANSFRRKDDSVYNHYRYLKPILKNNKPFILLQEIYSYTNGDCDYDCDELRYELIIVK